MDKIGDITSYNSATLVDGSLLMWDDTTGEWTPTTLSDALTAIIAEMGNFVGATPTTSGEAGLYLLQLLHSVFIS